MAKSVALQRRVSAYPPPKYHRLLVAYAEKHSVGKSEIICTALQAFFDALNPPKKKAL